MSILPDEQSAIFPDLLLSDFFFYYNDFITTSKESPILRTKK